MTVSTRAAEATSSPLAALVQCLEDEYSALLEGDFDRLERVLARKEQLLARLAAQPSAAIGTPQGDRARAGAAARLAMRRLRDLNQRNAQALAPRAAGNRARLQFLQSALGRGALYGADGVVGGPTAFSRSA